MPKQQRPPRLAIQPGNWDDLNAYLAGVFPFNVKEFGAVADGTTDDGPAIQLAIDAAVAYIASIPSGWQTKAVIYFPEGDYRIKTTIVPASNIHFLGRNAFLRGPITGAGRITSGTAVPSATDIAGQTAGACFKSTEISHVIFEGLVLSTFRFGFVSERVWSHARWKDVDFNDTDIGIFYYEGAQHPVLENVICGGNSNSIFAAAATCFAAGHPRGSLDNFYCDGFQYRNYKQTPNAVYNGDLDNWFENAILRPATSSVVTGGSYTFSPTGTARKVSGRLFYIPLRNQRACFSGLIGPVSAFQCPRGIIYMRYPVNWRFEDIGGEDMFHDATVNTGPDESMIVIGVNPGNYSALFDTVDADHARVVATYKGAIDIQVETSAGGTRLHGRNITGKVSDTSVFISLSGSDTPTNTIYYPNAIVKNGDDATGSANLTQFKFGFGGSESYAHFLRTRHNGGAAVNNALDIYTGNGTQAGVFPTHAIHGLSISNGKIGIGGIIDPTQAIHMPEAGNIQLGTTTGTKIGTASTQKLAFYNATPVVQPAANPDTSGAALAALETEVNELKALLRSVGLMAP